MLLIYGETRCNSQETQHIYADYLSQRHRPNRRTFVEVSPLVLDASNVCPAFNNRGSYQQVLANIKEQILDIMEN